MNASCKQPLFPNPLESLYIVNTTICNLRCVFCAYDRSRIKKQILPFEDFKAYIEKATRFGFDTFNLTPLIGEPLTDPLFTDKLKYLDQHEAVFDYYFSTNLTRADGQFFNIIRSLKKLRWVSVSVYGHDEESFLKITRSNLFWYQKLIENLHNFCQFGDILSRAEIKIRTVKSFDLTQGDSELCRVIKTLKEKGLRVRIPGVFSNWSGLVKNEQLEALNLQPKTNLPAKTEPCVFLFYKHTVLPDGTINACSVGDGQAQFIIGNLKQGDFEEIYSPANASYVKLIQSHLHGRMDEICQNCSAYRGISKTWYSYQYHRKESVSLPQFLQWLESHKGKKVN